MGAHLRSEGVFPTMFCSHWFITLFAYTLPFDHLLRTWDIFFLEGIKTVFRCERPWCSAAGPQSCFRFGC